MEVSAQPAPAVHLDLWETPLRFANDAAQLTSQHRRRHEGIAAAMGSADSFVNNTGLDVAQTMGHMGLLDQAP